MVQQNPPGVVGPGPGVDGSRPSPAARPRAHLRGAELRPCTKEGHRLAGLWCPGRKCLSSASQTVPGLHRALCRYLPRLLLQEIRFQIGSCHYRKLESTIRTERCLSAAFLHHQTPTRPARLPSLSASRLHWPSATFPRSPFPPQPCPPQTHPLAGRPAPLSSASASASEVGAAAGPSADGPASVPGRRGRGV